MLNVIDAFLNKITMYRLVLYYLIVLFGAAVIFGFLHLLPYNPLAIIFSTTVLITVCWATNKIFSKVSRIPVNFESSYITALILALIITPTFSFRGLIFLVIAGILAMSSKYILVIRKKHIFNPAAIAVVLTAFGINQSATWWVGSLVMLPFVFLGGLLIIKKTKREALVMSFFIASVLTIALFGILNNNNLVSLLGNVFFNSSLFFFAFVMLVEPLTTPPTKNLQMIYGIIVGILFTPQTHVGSLYSTPELALVAGNLFSYIVSPKEKLILKLKKKLQISPDTADFIFSLKNKLEFTPGQYMEWTLAYDKGDSRGSRRYFTLASSPTEDNIRLGVKLYQPSSGFKKALYNMSDQTSIIASQLAGEFTLPKNKTQKIVFIAGGIGITPFRSMLKYLLDIGEKRDIVVFYSNKNASEIVYKDILDQAKERFNLKTVYTLTDLSVIPEDWMGRKGRVDEVMIKEEIPDYNERIFYLSGPHAMVSGFEQTLKKMGTKKKQIKVDFFPGYA